MDYDPMVMDDAEALGPVVKISQVRFCRDSGCPSPPFWEATMRANCGDGI
jgi:hypothetical protein